MDSLLIRRGLQASAYSAKPRRVTVTSYAPRLVPGLPRQRVVSVSAAMGHGLAHPGEEASSSGASNSSNFSPLLSVPAVTMAKGGGGGANFGSGSSLGAVMEKSKMEFVMPTPVASTPKLDDGGDGGDIGKHNHNGGGGGDGGGDDDDDFFNEDGDGEGDGEGDGQNSFFRTVVPESYDKFSLGAVFAEWMKTVADLPLIIRRAVEMGLFSSAQLVRFFSMDVRPNLVRSVSRSLPPAWARDFVGRLMADPAFVQKLILESAFAACASLWYEYRARGENFKKELDLALINTLGMAAATAATVWLVSPTRSYGSVHKFPWQQALDQLPNCVFDVSGPLRQYTTQARAAGFFTKAAELSAVGLLTGTLTSLLSSAAVAIHRKYDPSFEPSVPVPEVARSSAGLAAFFAISANTRYQLLGGMDRYLFGHSNYLWTYLTLTGAARVASHAVAEQHRPFCQGLPEAGPLQGRKRVVRRKVVKKKMVAAQPEQVELAPVAAAAGVVAAAEPVFLDQVLAEPQASTSTPVAVIQDGEVVTSTSSSPHVETAPVASVSPVAEEQIAHAVTPADLTGSSTLQAAPVSTQLPELALAGPRS